MINWFERLMPSSVEDDISRLREEIWELKHRVSSVEEGLREERHERYMLGVRFRRLRKTLKAQGITMDLRTTEEE